MIKHIINVSRALNYKTLIFPIVILGMAAYILYTTLSSRPSLSIQYLGSLELIKNDTNLKNLKIYYNEEKVSSIIKSNFSILNNGGKTISNNGKVNSITIKYNGLTNILSAKIDKMTSNDINCRLDIDTAKLSLAIHFQILKPGDAIYFHDLISGESSFQIIGNVKGVKNIVTDNREDEFEKSGMRNGIVPFVLIGFIFMLSFIVTIYGYKKDLGFENLYLDDLDAFPEYKEIKDYIDFVNLKVGFITFRYKRKLKEDIYDLEENEQLRHNAKKLVVKAITDDKNLNDKIGTSSLYILICIILCVLIYFFIL